MDQQKLIWLAVIAVVALFTYLPDLWRQVKGLIPSGGGTVANVSEDQMLDAIQTLRKCKQKGTCDKFRRALSELEESAFAVTEKPSNPPSAKPDA